MQPPSTVHHSPSPTSSLSLPVFFRLSRAELEIQTDILPSVKLPKSFVAINLSEKVPDAFGEAGKQGESAGSGSGSGSLGIDKVEEAVLPGPRSL